MIPITEDPQRDVERILKGIAIFLALLLGIGILILISLLAECNNTLLSYDSGIM